MVFINERYRTTYLWGCVKSIVVKVVRGFTPILYLVCVKYPLHSSVKSTTIYRINLIKDL